MKRSLSVLIPMLILACSHEQPTQTTIQGSLMGHDGRPMTASKVMLFSRLGGKALAATEVGADGSFRLTTDETGMLPVRFFGVHHLAQTATVFVDEPTTVVIDARLATPAYREEMDMLTLRSKGKAPWDGRKLAPQPDGSYFTEFEAEESQIAYALEGALEEEQPGGLNVSYETSGTHAESYVSNERYRSRFYSVVTPLEGRVRITFDPSQLPRSDRLAEIRYSGESPRQARIRGIVQRMADWQTKASRERSQHRTDYERRAIEACRTDQQELSYNRQRLVPKRNEVSQLVGEVNQEEDPVVRQLLFLEYLEAMLPGEAADPAIVSRAVKEIPPTSPFWKWRSLNAYHIATLLRQAFHTIAQLEQRQPYAFELAENLPDDASVAGAFVGMWNRAQYDGETDFAHAIYDRMSQRLPGHSYTEWIERQLELPGQMAPEFSVPSLEDPDIRYTNANFRGKVYLIDFWAIWCSPCVGDMPRLHRLYDQYHSYGFEILGYSFDSEENLRKFRAEKWPMPWPTSAEPDKGFKSEIAKAFNVESVPHPVLVGRDGKILAAGEGFTVDQLEAELEQLLGGSNEVIEVAKR